MKPQLLIAGIALSIAAMTAPARAEANGNPYLPVTFSGFGTAGFAHAQGDGAAYIRDMAQTKGATNRGLSWELDSRIGLQANMKAGENLEAVAQIVSRYRNENDFRPELTWGFVKYTLGETVELRAGRVGYDAFLSSDSRDVGYSFLWVRPPVDYYGTLFFTYEDGGDVVFRMPLAQGRARLKLFAGITRENSSTLLEQREWAGHRNTQPIGSRLDLDGSRGSGGFIDYQDNHWIARLGVARLKIGRDFPTGSMNLTGFFRANIDQAYRQNNPALGQALATFLDDALVVNKHVDFASLALAYEDGPLQTQMALGQISANSLMIANARSGFVSAGYRIGSVTPYVLTSFIKSRRSNRADELARVASSHMVNLANFMLDAPRTTQNTYSIGMRYDFARNAALKFQLDMIRNRNCTPVSLPLGGPGESCAPPRLWPTVPVPWNGRADVYSAVLDFTF